MLFYCNLFQIVAPFPGSIMLSKKSNEIIIKAKGGSVKDMDIIITNIEPDKDIVAIDDPSYVDKRVRKILKCKLKH